MSLLFESVFLSLAGKLDFTVHDLVASFARLASSR